MTFTDLLSITGVLLAFDGLAFAFYMFATGILATLMGRSALASKMFAVAVISFVLGGLSTGFSNLVMEARLPIVFIFCIAVVGLVASIIGFIAICFSPSIFAFATNSPSKKWILPANVPFIVPFGPVFLFFFLIKDYPKAATVSGAVAAPQNSESKLETSKTEVDSPEVKGNEEDLHMVPMASAVVNEAGVDVQKTVEPDDKESPIEIDKESRHGDGEADVQVNTELKQDDSGTPVQKHPDSREANKTDSVDQPSETDEPTGPSEGITADDPTAEGS